MLKGNRRGGYRVIRLGVDIDNTLADLNTELVKEYGISLEEYPARDLPTGFFSTDKGLDLLAKAKPLQGAVEALRVFSRLGSEVFYITSRHPLTLGLTREWLKAWGFPRGATVFLPRGRKKLFASACCIDLFFEDDPEEAAQLQDVVNQVYVLAWPYNAGLGGPGIYRFASWEELLGKINLIAKIVGGIILLS